METQRFRRIAKALADPQRFEILERIAGTEGEEVAYGTLARRLPVTQATVSHHLKELASAGLVTRRREAQYGYYRYRPEAMAAYLREMRRRVLSRDVRSLEMALSGRACPPRGRA